MEHEFAELKTRFEELNQEHNVLIECLGEQTAEFNILKQKFDGNTI